MYIYALTCDFKKTKHNVPAAACYFRVRNEACSRSGEKHNHALMETLTAETDNSRPRESQLITKATTPNKHTLGR